MMKPGSHWGYPFVQLLMDSNVDILLLPCAESSFGGYDAGLKRSPHGIDYYSKLKDYENYCIKLAEQTASSVAEIVRADYNLVCILGVEHSPTCAINYMYSHKGTLHRQGLLISHLLDNLSQLNITPPCIGINRSYPKKSLTMLKNILSCAI